MRLKKFKKYFHPAMTGLITAIYLTILTPSLIAIGASSPEKFVAAYVEAVNEKSPQKLRDLVHPDCLKDLTADEKRFIDEVWCEGEFKRIIPSNYKFWVTEWKEAELPFSNMTTWKVKPTHQTQIDFKKEESSSVTIIRWIKTEGDTLYLIVPIPKDEYLKKALEKNKGKQK
jgi:hypothetical protein